jgi:hypothetical protein
VAHKKGIKIIVQEKSAQNQVKLVHKMKKKFEPSRNRTYVFVNLARKIPCSGHSKKKKRKLMSKMSSKNHNVVPDTSSCSDRLLDRSRTFGNLPLVAEHMLLKRLESKGVLLSSKNCSADVNCVDSCTTSDSSDENSSPCRTTENEGILMRCSEGNDISSKVGDQLCHEPKQVDRSIHIKKVLLKRNFKVTGVDENKEFVLYLPYVEYWLNEVNSKFQTFEEFEREVLIQFPPSFRWLLTECARLLQMTTQDLYYELLNVELAYCYLLRPQDKSMSEELKKNIEMNW